MFSFSNIISVFDEISSYPMPAVNEQNIDSKIDVIDCEDYLSYMPQDILICIFKKLTFRDVQNIKKVSRLFSKIASDQVLEEEALLYGGYLTIFAREYKKLVLSCNDIFRKFETFARKESLCAVMDLMNDKSIRYPAALHYESIREMIECPSYELVSKGIIKKYDDRLAPHFNLLGNYILYAINKKSDGIYSKGFDGKWICAAIIVHKHEIKRSCFSDTGTDVLNFSSDCVQIYGANINEKLTRKVIIRFSDDVIQAMFAMMGSRIIAMSNIESKIYDRHADGSWLHKKTISHGDCQSMGWMRTRETVSVWKRVKSTDGNGFDLIFGIEGSDSKWKETQKIDSNGEEEGIVLIRSFMSCNLFCIRVQTHTVSIYYGDKHCSWSHKKDINANNSAIVFFKLDNLGSRILLGYTNGVGLIYKEGANGVWGQILKFEHGSAIICGEFNSLGTMSVTCSKEYKSISLVSIGGCFKIHSEDGAGNWVEIASRKIFCKQSLLRDIVKLTDTYAIFLTNKIVDIYKSGRGHEKTFKYSVVVCSSEFSPLENHIKTELNSGSCEIHSKGVDAKWFSALRIESGFSLYFGSSDMQLLSKTHNGDLSIYAWVGYQWHIKAKITIPNVTLSMHPLETGFLTNSISNKTATIWEILPSSRIKRATDFRLTLETCFLANSTKNKTLERWKIQPQQRDSSV